MVIDEYLLNKTYLMDNDENVEYDDSILNINYVGKKDFTIELRIDSSQKIHLDMWRSGEKSGAGLRELKKIIRCLIKLKHINLSTEFLLEASDINHGNALDRLIKYYERIGFTEDKENKSEYDDMFSMKSTIAKFLN